MRLFLPFGTPLRAQSREPFRWVPLRLSGGKASRRPSPIPPQPIQGAKPLENPPKRKQPALEFNESCRRRLKACKVLLPRRTPRAGAAMRHPVLSLLHTAHKTRNGRAFYKTGIVRGAAPCSAGKGQGKTCDEVFPVDEKGLQKGKTANCFSLLMEHIKFYEEIQEADCFFKKKRGEPPNSSPPSFEEDNIQNYIKKLKKQNASRKKKKYHFK